MNNIKSNKNKDEELIYKFFKKNKSEIADNGFSDKLKLRLPERKKNYDWIVWIFASAGISVTLYIVINLQIVIQLPAFNDGKSIFYFIGGVFILPLLLCPALKSASVNCLNYRKLSDLLLRF